MTLPIFRYNTHMRLLLLTTQTASPGNDAWDIIETLKDLKIDYQVRTAKTPAALAKCVKKDDAATCTAAAVYGGDGTVAPVLKAAARTRLPVLILPGGTDNSIARTSGAPAKWQTSLQALTDNRYLVRYRPIALANDTEFVADVHFGWAAESLSETSPGLKKVFGRLAYTIQAVRQKAKTAPQRYSFRIDGRTRDYRAYSCFIANMGNPQLPGMPLFRASHRIRLRLALLRKKNTLALARWYLLRRAGLSDPTTVTIRSGHAITLMRGPKHGVIDERPFTPSYPLKITMSERQVGIIVPEAHRFSPKSAARWLQTAWYRNTDQLRRIITGVPSERFSLIGPRLYLGGQYGSAALDEFKRRGITGIVSMRTYVPKPLTDHGIDILHLPTTDLAAPKLEDLEKGIAFIDRHVKKGGRVYVHCRQGEGRGPTMAAAYLISLGMRPQDAIAHLQAFRPFANPTKPQRKRLVELYDRLHTRPLA